MEKRNILIDNKNYEYSLVSLSGGDKAIALNGNLYPLGNSGDQVNVFDFGLNNQKQIFINDKEFIVKSLNKVERVSREQSLGAGAILSPMPGKVFKVLKEEGEKVRLGEPILILEAMKMEHTLYANTDGIIEKIYYKEGEQVAGSEVLCSVSENEK